MQQKSNNQPTSGGVGGGGGQGGEIVKIVHVEPMIINRLNSSTNELGDDVQAYDIEVVENVVQAEDENNFGYLFI